MFREKTVVKFEHSSEKQDGGSTTNPHHHVRGRQNVGLVVPKSWLLVELQNKQG